MAIHRSHEPGASGVLLQGVVFEDDLTVPCHRRASVEIVAALRRYAGSQQRLGRGHGVG